LISNLSLFMEKDLQEESLFDEEHFLVLG